MVACTEAAVEGVSVDTEPVLGVEELVVAAVGAACSLEAVA